ncbi:hypothetical protein MBLNU459_g7056t1 [Dothideomycetes sp. NU459]
MDPDQPRTRKRKATKEADNRADRKRVQNRISQQCLREKQLARTRQLESAMEIIKNSANQLADGHSPNAPAMEAQLKLIAENEQLREAVFRMRKKLLSLSHMAASAADDEIFETLLSGEMNRRSSNANDADEPPQVPADHNVAAQDKGIGEVANEASAAVPVEKLSSVASSSLNTTHMDFGNITPGAYPAPNDNSDPDFLSYLVEPEFNGSSEDPQSTLFNGTSCFIPLIEGLGHEHEHEHEHEHAPPDTLGADYQCGLLLLAPAAFPIASRASHFADKIIKACHCYHQSLTPAEQRREQHYSFLQVDDPVLTEATKGLAMIATHLMSNLAGIQPYIYGVNAATPIELILRWRISKSITDRLAIPEPFRPTPLQYSSMDHSTAIDMVNWGSIRDQLIINSGAVDLDTMTKDIVMNTVIEDPTREVCLNVYDVFYNKFIMETHGNESKFGVARPWRTAFGIGPVA